MESTNSRVKHTVGGYKKKKKVKEKKEKDEGKTITFVQQDEAFKC